MRTRSLFFLLSCGALSGFASLAGEADDPQIAANGSGNLVAFWEEYATNHFAIRQATYLADSGWQTSGTLSSGSRDAFDPEAAMNAGGDILAVWRQNTGGYYATYAATGVLGSSWGTPVQLSTSDSAFAEVQIDAAGKGVAVWQEKDGTGAFHIATSSFTPGSGWSTAAALSGSSQILMTPETAAGSSGRTVATWQMPSDPGPLFNLAIQAAFYSAGAGWSTPVTLSDPTHDSVSPNVGVSSTGEALVVWEGKVTDDGLDQVSAVVLSAGGVWQTPVTLSNSSFEAYYPYLAMNGAGQAVVAWLSKESGAVAVRAITRSSGGVWSSIAELSSSSGASDAEVAINSSGKAVVIWTEERAEDALIHAAIYSSGSWGSPVTISTAGLWGASPEVRVNDDGSGAVVWQSQVGDTISILSAHLATNNTWASPVVIN